ncbi:MAG: bis(5'-nucleosyl)-tetraphosphatase (symmetrical) YqeK [Oscillospiraceae bacterium]
MQNIEELKKLLQSRLTSKRFVHSLNVADEAKKLAEIWGFDEEKAYLAGLLHDISKDILKNDQKSAVENSLMNVSEIEKKSPPLLHSIAGAFYIKNTLKIDDDDLINAVRYHTVAREGMSILEKIVYMADLVSIDRTYANVEEMRKFAHSDLDLAMFEALKFSIKSVLNKGTSLPLTTVDAYNQYALILSKR